MKNRSTTAQLAALAALSHTHKAPVQRDTTERGTGDILCHLYPPNRASALMFRVARSGQVTAV